jgi:hypothetical protein
MGQISIPSDGDVNGSEIESSITSQRQQQIDDAAYSDIENAIQPTSNAADVKDASSVKERDTVERIGSNIPGDEESQMVASAYDDMDHIIKNSANITPAAIKPPLPPGRISAQAEAMVDALEGDELAVAKKIAKDRADANRDIRPPLPPGRISAQAEEMIDALEGGELAVAKNIAKERSDANRDNNHGLETYEGKVERKIRDGAYATPSTVPEEDSSSTPTRNELERNNGVAIRPEIRPTPRSMLPRQDTDGDKSNKSNPEVQRQNTPILEASLVPEVPLYEATLIDASVSLAPSNAGYSGVIPPTAVHQGEMPIVNDESPEKVSRQGNNENDVAEVPWWRKRQGMLLIVLILVFGGAMATMGAFLASGNDNDSSDDVNHLTAGSDDVGSLEPITEETMTVGPTQSPVGLETPDKTQPADTVDDSTPSDLDNSQQTAGPTTAVPSTLKPSTLEPTTSKPTAAPATPAPTVTLYYPDFENDQCISDVSGRPLAEQGQRLFVSIEACCKAEFWQLQHEDHNECVMNSLGLTHGPTLSPSARPTSSPSKQPSKQPSMKPSMKPSSSPTSKPSDEPTSKPSAKPTIDPTIQPSPRPTRPPVPFNNNPGGFLSQCPRESMDLCCLGEVPSSFASRRDYCFSLGCDRNGCGMPPPGGRPPPPI